MYEKPVATILKMEDSMQIICSSGVTNKTNFKVGDWEKHEEVNADGTSDSLKELPDWLRGL